jgi:endonuclease IV
MKIGLKLFSTNTDFYYQEAQRLYLEKCFDYIELYVVPGRLETLEYWKKLPTPFSIHAPHSMNGFNLADKAKEKSNLKIYQEVKAFANQLGASKIIFHAGSDGSIEETARQLKALNEPRALLENKPYRAIPNTADIKCCRGYNTEEILYAMEETKCGFCLDFAHAVCAANSLNLDIYLYIERFLALEPSYFHLSDVRDLSSEYDSHTHLGEGSLNIQWIKQKMGAASAVTIETEKSSPQSLDDFKKDIQWLTKLG